MIFLTGPHGTGKTNIAQTLNECNFVFIDLGSTLRQEWKREKPEISFDSWASDKGQEYIDNFILQKIKKLFAECQTSFKPVQDIVVVGNRSLRGINHIIDNMKSVVKKNYIFYIDTPKEKLFKQYCSREGNGLGVDEFEAILEKDRQFGIDELSYHSDIKIINDGSLNELLEKMNYQLTNLGYIVNNGENRPEFKSGENRHKI